MLAVETCARVFSQQFMNNFNLNPDSNVTILNGGNLDPRQFGYNGNVPEAKFYTFFYIVPKSMRSNQIKRIFVCQHKQSPTSKPCGHIRTDFSKFFDHIRMHSGELPFRCSYEGCTMRFAFRGNLIRHMHSHLGIKKFGCYECGKRFSNNHNLKKHSTVHH